jgi:hypothetical protein
MCVANECLGSMRTVKSFASEKFEEVKFFNKTKLIYDVGKI